MIRGFHEKRPVPDFVIERGVELIEPSQPEKMG
jgi:hypothetical protein